MAGVSQRRSFDAFDYKSRLFVLKISTSDFASCRDTFREAGTEVTRATISEDGVRIVISSPA
jgi:hypothetical protein